MTRTPEQDRRAGVVIPYHYVGPFDHEAFNDSLMALGCPHDEHDHGICLECGQDIMDDLVGAAEMAADAAQDR